MSFTAPSTQLQAITVIISTRTFKKVGVCVCRGKFWGGRVGEGERGDVISQPAKKAAPSAPWEQNMTTAMRSKPGFGKKFFFFRLRDSVKKVHRK